MTTLSVMVGIPGCGKSTFAESGFIPGVVLSSDKIRKMYWTETDQTHNAEVFDILKSTTATLLADGKDAIVDATNLKPEWRAWCIDMAHDSGAECKAYSFERVSLDTCLERNRHRDRQVPEDVIRRYADMLVTPTKEEGFDDVIIINPRGLEKKIDSTGRLRVDTSLVEENDDPGQAQAECVI